MKKFPSKSPKFHRFRRSKNSKKFKLPSDGSKFTSEEDSDNNSIQVFDDDNIKSETSLKAFSNIGDDDLKEKLNESLKNMERYIEVYKS